MSPQVSRVSPLLIRSRPRSIKDRETFIPNNILSTLTGFGFVMLGWTGFNGGDPFVTSTDASMDILNMHICTATSVLTWLILDIVFFNKPSVFGATQGIITGLVCITLGAGVVQGWAAIIMGLLSGSIPWYTMMILQKKCSLLKKVDDTLGVLHTHAIAGMLGGILTGIFVEPKLNRIFYLVENWQHYIGFAYGIQSGRFGAGLKQLVIQILGLVFVICLLIKVVVPLRLDEEALHMGDDSVHGERAYTLYGDGEKRESFKENTFYGLA